ncbi:nuclear transport factor 2 family protein [Micromonospora olivasterospora]|uniref:SnoaL-like protein n=1 Tax=Micromonospora olivasterospora TaxID=1880 RepID=A0A562I3H7_MICOL|nr:nuclear transport factor 2 family protein [Micromonospora olivasterospora]TWH65205.1 SnoaL-like protein [Micromonospora olivasterospora]
MTIALEERIRRLESHEEIRRLKAHYAYLCDTGADADRYLELFTEDGAWIGDHGFGEHRGTEALRRFYADSAGRMSWAFHVIVAPHIELSEDGNSAKVRWYLWQPSTVNGRGDHWVSGWYDDTMRIEDGRWKFVEMRLRFATIAPFDAGWSAAQFGPFAASAAS